MSSYFPAEGDVHSNDPHWMWDEFEAEIYVDTPPPADVLLVQDASGDQWSRKGDRWYVSFRPSHVAFGNSGETPDDLRVYREWWEIAHYGPFTIPV